MLDKEFQIFEIFLLFVKKKEQNYNRKVGGGGRERGMKNLLIKRPPIMVFEISLTLSLFESCRSIFSNIKHIQMYINKLQCL